MQFVVPQFIEVETKIIGPISARQFIIVLVTAGLLFLEFRLFQMIIFIPAGILTGAVGGALAFGKVNGQSMHYFLLNVVETVKRPTIKFWSRGNYVQKEVEEDTDTQDVRPKAELTESSLASMSLMVDTGGAYVSEEVAQAQENKQKK